MLGPALCLAIAGVLRTTLPGDTFTLAWSHSVQHSEWQEDYRATPTGLVLEEARVQGSGAGMEPAADAVLREGWWRWHPRRSLPFLTLTVSSFTSDYRICTAAGCRELRSLVGPFDDGAAVTISPCRDPAAARAITPPR